MKSYKIKLESISISKPPVKNTASILFPKPPHLASKIYQQHYNKRISALFDTLNEMASLPFPPKILEENSTIERLASASSSIKPKLQDGLTDAKLPDLPSPYHYCFGRTAFCVSHPSNL